MFVRYDAAIVGVVRLFSVAVAACLMDRAGRKALLYTSSMLMFLASLTLTMISHTTPCPSPLNVTLTSDYGFHGDTGHTLGAGHQGPGSVIPLIATMVFIFGECRKSSFSTFAENQITLKTLSLIINSINFDPLSLLFLRHYTFDHQTFFISCQ